MRREEFRKVFQKADTCVLQAKHLASWTSIFCLLLLGVLCLLDWVWQRIICSLLPFLWQWDNCARCRSIVSHVLPYAQCCLGSPTSITFCLTWNKQMQNCDDLLWVQRFSPWSLLSVSCESFWHPNESASWMNAAEYQEHLQLLPHLDSSSCFSLFSSKASVLEPSAMAPARLLLSASNWVQTSLLYYACRSLIVHASATDHRSIFLDCLVHIYSTTGPPQLTALKLKQALLLQSNTPIITGLRLPKACLLFPAEEET